MPNLKGGRAFMPDTSDRDDRRPGKSAVVALWRKGSQLGTGSPSRSDTRGDLRSHRQPPRRQGLQRTPEEAPRRRPRGPRAPGGTVSGTTKVLSFRLPESLAADVAAVAYAEGLSVSMCIREGLSTTSPAAGQLRTLRRRSRGGSGSPKRKTGTPRTPRELKVYCVRRRTRRTAWIVAR
jgi:hypothetical protein